MCDTIATVRDGVVLFAKNSDRDGNEAQAMEWYPRQTHAPGSRVQCTWIDLPQVERTNAILISRPFWMWGAEIGTNEHGVTIGNQAVFTRQPCAKTGLTGMDILRLALERADSAREACDVITLMLVLYGQGGGCGHENRRFTYHNAYLIADRKEAYVLETAGRYWAVEPIHGARSISNELTIPRFRAEHGTRLHGAIACAGRRGRRTRHLAELARAPHDMMRILRDYGPGVDRPHYNWVNGGMAAPCMHAGGLLAASQTTASWVAELTRTGARHWVTATATPSLSLFKPVSVGGPLKDTEAPDDRYNASLLWWKHERFSRRLLQDPDRWLRAFTEERDAIERAWLQSPPSTAEAFRVHHQLLDAWNARLDRESIRDRRPWYVRRYWRRRDAAAGMPPAYQPDGIRANTPGASTPAG